MSNRPNTARPGSPERPEPHLAAPGAPSRPAMPRPLAARPAGDGARSDNAPLRFPTDQRHSSEMPHLALSAEDRLIVSGAAAASSERRPRRSALRGVLLIILLGLAGIGAFTIYQAAARILHP